MLVCFSIGLLALFSFIAGFNLCWAPRLQRGLSKLESVRTLKDLPLVSVLVPARNEGHQIARCVKSLLLSDYQHLEVIVADDQSTDDTLAKLIKLQSEHGERLRILQLSESPPLGWTGKARTCHELARQARGDILIFCDADVCVHAQAVSASVGYLLKDTWSALTALPFQSGGSPLVQAIVAVITQFLILISLPLPLVPRLKSAALATGNGQWFGWRRRLYEAVGGHEVVKDSLIEDIELGRLVKAAGGHLWPVLAAGCMRVNMYQSWSEARLGFRKNLCAIFGDSTAVCVLVVGLTSLLLIAPIGAAWAGQWGGVGVLLTLNASLLLAQRFSFSTPLRVLAVFPVAVILALIVLMESLIYTRRGQLEWKGRNLSIS